MEAERLRQIFAVFLIAVTGRGVLGGTGSGGNITFFEVTPTLVPLDSSFTIKCTIDGTGLQFPPSVHIRKSFSGRSWPLSEDDVEEEEGNLGELAPRVNVVSNSSGLAISATLTVVSARGEDTGNYTCSTSNTTNKRTTFVSVLIDPVNATMLLDGREVAGRVNVELGRTYAVSCVVTGGNPCPNMTLISGTLNLTDQISYTRELKRGSPTELLSPVTCRSSGYITWKADVAYIGKPLTCSAGVVQGRSTVMASFEPHINHTEPLFYCTDTVTLRSYETEMMINCSVYSQVADLTRAYVYWHTPTANMSIDGNLRSDTEVPNSQDGHFRLSIRSPANSTVNHWWHMILKVSSVRSLTGNLPQNTLYEFVAINKYATAKHTVQSVVEGVTPVGGAGTLKTFSSTLVALIAALSSSMLLVVRP